jgi:hypothetical protein
MIYHRLNIIKNFNFYFKKLIFFLMIIQITFKFVYLTLFFLSFFIIWFFFNLELVKSTVSYYNNF